MTGQPIGDKGVPAGSHFNQSLPQNFLSANLHEDIAALGMQQLPGEGSGEQRASTIVPHDYYQGTQMLRDAGMRPPQVAVAENPPSSLKDDENNRSSNFQRNTDFNLTQSRNGDVDQTMHGPGESADQTNTAANTTLQHQQLQNQQAVQNLHIQLSNKHHNKHQAPQQVVAQPHF